MDGRGNAAPVIIKRKRPHKGEAPHGGAWKVAYADFVTAMMAFFMLMWLLNATTEMQRKGLADYFAPSIPISRVSGGGNGAFKGESMFAEEAVPQTGAGATDDNPTDAEQARGDTGVDLAAAQEAEDALFQSIEEQLSGRSGESLVPMLMARHVVTRVTDEGLIIELFATEGAPLFRPGTSYPTLFYRDLVAMVARVAGAVSNKAAVGGHVHAQPVVLAKNPVWELSHARADRTRELLEAGGMDSGRIARVTGHADRKLAVPNPMSARNDRIEIVLLRQGRS